MSSFLAKKQDKSNRLLMIKYLNKYCASFKQAVDLWDLKYPQIGLLYYDNYGNIDFVNGVIPENTPLNYIAPTPNEVVKLLSLKGIVDYNVYRYQEKWKFRHHNFLSKISYKSYEEAINALLIYLLQSKIFKVSKKDLIVAFYGENQ